MTDRLPEILDSRPHGDGGIALTLHIQPELAWFIGHFPAAPILPGVVQIDWALHFARRLLGLDLPSARDFQVKFKALIIPGDRLILTLVPDIGRRRLDFDYRRGDAVCSIGRVRLP
jgi:3-hydroxymyristoyl/3-hydroxydecanoyl-(acyl carrier protein) dehydratase